MTEIITTAKVNIMLDASKIDLFETCPMRYDLRHNRNKTLPLIQKAKALDLGSLAHNGMEVYYNGLAEGQHYNDRMHNTLLKIRSLAADPNESNVELNELQILIDAIEQSCDYWRADDEQLEILAVESPFAYVLFEDDDLRIVISGKIDLLVNKIGIGREASYLGLPIDHKTSKRDYPVLRKSNQFINYANAVNSNYLIVNKIGLQKTLKSEEKFKRIPLSYDPVYIQAWKDNLITMLLQEYIACLAENKWPEKPTSCNKFNRVCEYYDVCDSSGQDAKDFKLEANYIDAEPWDVTKSIGEVE